jgi:hypothetical protein
VLQVLSIFVVLIYVPPFFVVIPILLLYSSMIPMSDMLIPMRSLLPNFLAYYHPSLRPGACRQVKMPDMTQPSCPGNGSHHLLRLYTPDCNRCGTRSRHYVLCMGLPVGGIEEIDSYYLIQVITIRSLGAFVI